MNLELNLSLKRACTREFLEEMNRILPWVELEKMLVLDVPADKRRCPTLASEVMLRIYLLQQWFGLSDAAMAEALHDVPVYYMFVGLDNLNTPLLDEGAIRLFHHLLEKHALREQILSLVNGTLLDKGVMLRAGTVVDAVVIRLRGASRIETGEAEPEMRPSKNGKQMLFGPVGGSSGASRPEHPGPGSSESASNSTQVANLWQNHETDFLGHAGSEDTAKRRNATDDVTSCVPVKSCEPRVLSTDKWLDSLSRPDRGEHNAALNRTPKAMATVAARLTPREIEVLKWHAEGKTNEQISNILHIAIDTVKFHTKNAIEKLGASNKTSAAVRATVLGLLN